MCQAAAHQAGTLFALMGKQTSVTLWVLGRAVGASTERSTGGASTCKNMVGQSGKTFLRR